MKPLFKHAVLSDSKAYVSDYTCKTKDGKVHSGVTIDANYEDCYAYPYDLAWKLPMLEYEEVPNLEYIEDGKLNSIIELRDDQKPYVEALLKCPRGTFISKPGTGKTVMCLELISISNLKTLIIVNTGYLFNQWKDECKKLLGYEPGLVGDSKFKVKDITIATFQTLFRSREKLEKLYDKFSLVIVDECHHCPAQSFKYVLGNLNALFKLGVTGTNKRKDGLEFITDWVLSDHKLYNTNDNTLIPDIIIVKTGIKVPSGDTFVECLSELAIDERVLDKVSEMLERNPERNQLVLALRLSTIELLAAMYEDAIVITGDKGDRTNLDERILDSKIIFSTLLNEGANIPNLDTLHLVHPNNNIPLLEQRIARINRPVIGKETPIVYDYWYKHNKGTHGFNVETQQSNRLQYYKKQGYKVYEI